MIQKYWDLSLINVLVYMFSIGIFLYYTFYKTMYEENKYEENYEEKNYRKANYKKKKE